MAKILVTGADGMLGQDLCPILEKYNYNVIKTDIKTLDITDFDTAQTVINAHSPDMIIHCAAYTNVDKAEEDFETAKLINASGTENIAKICALKIFLFYTFQPIMFLTAKNKHHTNRMTTRIRLITTD